MMKNTLMILSLLMSLPAMGQTMYKCPNATGTVNFQQMPCSPQGGGEAVTVKAMPASAGSSPAVDTSESSRVQQLANTAGKERRLLEITREISTQDSKINGYRSSMDSEMTRLQNKKRRANNNLAGATWEQSISDEMNAVSSQYDALIRSSQSRIEQLRDEENRLRDEK